jgi:hypothetical protein
MHFKNLATFLKMGYTHVHQEHDTSDVDIEQIIEAVKKIIY